MASSSVSGHLLGCGLRLFRRSQPVSPCLVPSTRRDSGVLVRASADDDDFEARLAKLRKKGASGTGKKAEERKAKKEGLAGSDDLFDGSDVSTSRPAVQVLPPVPLEDPVSEGLPIVLGFSSYSERLNGRMAMVGLVALLAIELASGEGFLKYHDGATIGVQLYFLAGLGALYVKYDKERSSIWPN